MRILRNFKEWVLILAFTQFISVFIKIAFSFEITICSNRDVHTICLQLFL